jgi:methionine synthase II (cobalamin-independent)
MNFNPKGIATAIGSFPHKDAAKACELVLKYIPEMPIWPQLPNIDFKEQMEIQYCEGFPCVILDESKQRMYFNIGGDITNDLEKFFEHIASEDYDYFKISPSFSRGIYEMEKQLAGVDKNKTKYFKSQITGPVTFGLSTVDENKKALFYDDMFRDVIIKGITMKAKWLINKFRAFGQQQVCFVDEPILTGFGSSTYVSVQKDDVVNSLGEVVEALHADNALIGTHCCGNTEWNLLIDAGVDMISFDSFEFGETIGYYPEKVNEYLKKGGVLTFGAIPTSEKIRNETTDSLFTRLETVVENLSKKGIKKDLIWEKCLLTPSCGTGSLPIELSEKIMVHLSEVSEKVKNKYSK